MSNVGLRIFGALVAILLTSFAVARYRRGLLRRGEMVLVAVVVVGLGIAAIAPSVFDPLLSALGFHAGNEARIVGLLVISNLFTLALVFRGFSREDQLSNEVGDLVDSLALKRLTDAGWSQAPGFCAVVMPAFNEAENIGSVLTALPHTIVDLPTHPIVVADGCTDDTEKIASDLGATVIRRDLRRGSGAAVRLGYEAALRAGARVIVTMDADGQHDPVEIERLVAPIVQGRADMVQGSRVLGSFEVDSRIRKHGVTFFARWISGLSRLAITDPSTGFRAVTAAGLTKLELRQDQFYVSELIVEAARKGLRVIEVPITLRRRNGGTTKKPAPIRYAWGFSKAMLRTWLR